MAHEIGKDDVFGENRTAGERAWHGLGIDIGEGLTAQEGFQKIGLGWGTDLIPVECTWTDAAGKVHKIKDDDFKMHVRCDTATSLGIVGKDYRIISNKYLAEFADALAGQDKAVKLETAGSLRGGKRVFCTIKLPRDLEVVDGDMLQQYIVGSNAHDGTAAFQFYGTSVRVVCANTLAWSESSGRNFFKFQHSGNVELKVEQARAALGIILKKEAHFEKECKSLAKLKLSTAKAHDYFDAVYDQTFGKISKEWPEKEQIRRAEHKTKQIAAWMELLEHETNTLKGMKGSAWAAYNAFSYWSDHERGRFKSTKESDARVHSNLFGISFNDKKKAFHRALAIV